MVSRAAPVTAPRAAPPREWEIFEKYAGKPFVLDRARLDGTVQVTGSKPIGTWFSVRTPDPGPDDCDWLTWCIDNDFDEYRLRYVSPVVLDLDKILQIRTVAELDQFSAKYGESYDSRGDSYKHQIRWGDVQAARWSGILIAPYFWERRMDDHTSWYYGWDCASGCVWGYDAILNDFDWSERDHQEG